MRNRDDGSGHGVARQVITEGVPAVVERKRAVRQHVPRYVYSAALLISLVSSAFVMSVAIVSPGLAWLGWLSLLPLFVAIRVSLPRTAFLCGGLWGACLWAFSLADNSLASFATPASFALLTTVPAIYAYLGAWLTRWIGYSPFVLGFGWMGVELAFAPVGLDRGLLGVLGGDGTVVSWIGNSFGYVLVAFLVALVNASLVSILSGVRLATASRDERSLPGNNGARLLPQTLFCFSRFALRPSQPRAPPF
ncbi:MAG: hypothetical protein JSU63_06165 [Phycisphaerales bacterium]|nr:MAG: hypothetical protein JSU63_06165 [Phycisphaerales bacterium]